MKNNLNIHESICSVTIKGKDLLMKNKNYLKRNETAAILNNLGTLKNFEEILQLCATDNKNNLKMKDFEKLPIKMKTMILMRIYKDINSNLNFAFGSSKLEKILTESDHKFWVNFRNKKIKSEQVKNMESNNIQKHEKLLYLNKIINEKENDLKNLRELKQIEFDEVIKEENNTYEEIQKQKKLNEMDQQNKLKYKINTINSFFGK